MKEKYHILITDPINPGSINKLKKEGFIIDIKKNLSKEDLLKTVDKYEVIIGRTSTKLDMDIIEKASKLRCIGVVATGWNHVDIKAAKKNGVVVLGLPPDKNKLEDHYTKGSFIPSAEHVMLCMLATAGDFIKATSSMKNGSWEKFNLNCTELYGKTLGIIGLGRIGSLVAKRAQAFGMKVLSYHPRLTNHEIEDRGAESVSMEKLLKTSDFITIHVPQNDNTIGLIGRKEFAQMKDGVILINTARPLVIDEEALTKALDKKIRYAVLDVHKGEPNEINWNSLKHPKIVATPHIAGVSKEGLRRTSSHVVNCVINYLNNGDTTYGIQ